MANKKARTFAEHAILQWMEREGLDAGYFALETHGRRGTVTDSNGDSRELVYDADGDKVGRVGHPEDWEV